MNRLISPFGSLLLLILTMASSQFLIAQTTRYVNPDGVCGGSTPCYTSIKNAVTAAAANDIIQLDPVVFAEPAFNLDKVVTIKGANAGKSGNDASRGPESRISNTKITVTAAATIDGVEIYQTNNTQDAILIQAAATLTNSVVAREGDDAGIVARGVTTAVGTSGYAITNNLFTGDDSGGLFGGHKTWNSGIWINGGSGTIGSNSINNCRTGVNIDNFNANITVSGNTIESCGSFLALGGTTPITGEFTLGSNDFRALVSAFINLSNVSSTFRLDISSSTYEGVSFSDLDLEDQLLVESTMFHRGRSGRNGVVDYVPNTQFVVALNPGIQAAVDAASAGGLVYVGSGSYSGTVIVNKALEIRGANYNINPNLSTRADESILTGTFSIRSSNVNINGFAVTGTGAAFAAGGVGPWSNITLANNLMEGNSGQQTVAYGFSLGSVTTSIGATNWNISNNRILDIQATNATALALFNITGLSIVNNVIEHTNAAFTGRRGMNLDGCQNVFVNNNSVNNGLVNPAPDNSDGAFTNASYQIQLSASASGRAVSNVEISSNVLQGAYDGIITLGNGVFIDIDIASNNISNNVIGVRFQAGTNAPAGSQSSIRINNNSIMTSNRCIYLQDGTASGGTPDEYSDVNIFNNSLIRSTTGHALEVQSTAILTGTVNASCNWWGTFNNTEINSKVLGNLIFLPYLNSGIDLDESSVGFQPDLSAQGGEVSSVSGNSQPILNGSTTYSATNLTLMGSVNVNGSLVRNYQLTTGGTCGGDGDTEIVSVTTSDESRFLVAGIVPGNYSSETTINFTITFIAGETPGEFTDVCVISTTTGDYTFGLKGVATEPEALPAVAEIRGNNTLISNGDFTPSTQDHTNFGIRSTPGELVRIFTITNAGAIGAEELTVSSISFTGAQAANFSVSSSNCSVLQAGQSCQFEVTFDSEGATGVFNATVVVNNSDPSRNPYEFAVRAEVYAPVISVRGNNTTINNGDETPVSNNNTFMGNASAGQSISRTYNIKNLGLGSLTFGSNPVVLSAANNGGGHTNFEVTTQPSGPLGTNQETNFTIRFNSPGQGNYFALVTLTSSGGTFTFVIQANGPSPRMRVVGNNQEIANGATTVSTTNFTDYGTRGLNSPLVRAFTIQNPGSLGAQAPLQMTGTPRVVLSGPGASMFTVTIQPGATVGVNSSTQFRIQYRPTAVGCHWAQVSIANNDPMRNPYTFVVRGNTAGQSCSPTYDGLANPGSMNEMMVDFDANNEITNLSVYPNPSINQIWIASPERKHTYKLEIYHIDGRLVRQINTYGGTELLDISDWMPGVYIIRSDDRDMTPLRFVKI